MHLSGLEIHGFKSFPHKTRLTFTPGVMAIVGPNGCGKTNIVDAVRWVLGEQRSSVLRSEKMEHVIFAGSLRAKPAPRAEVTLILENDRGVLPEDYSELAITRRLNRDGESDYQINRRPSRLKDIRNLFSDTGLGPDSYSIIELKMVETILSNRPDERRRLFEEAAGVTGYKAKLKTTRYRLKETRSDLTRLDDLLAEVTTRRNSLKRQVNKARRFRHLREALRVRDIRAAASEVVDLRGKVGPMDLGLKQDRQRREELDEIILKGRQRAGQLRGKLSAAEEQIQSAAGEKSRADERLAATRREIDVLEERLRSGRRRSDQRDQEEETLSQRTVDVDARLRELAVDEESARTRAREIREKLEGMQGAWDELQERVQAHNQRRDNAERERVKAERDQARADSALRQDRQRLQAVETRLDASRSAPAPDAPEPPAAAAKRVEELTAAVDEADRAVQAAREAEETAREERNAADRNTVGLGRDLNSARERVDFLERIVHSGKGRSQAVQELLAAGIDGVLGRLGDAIVVKDETARRAVAAAAEHLTDAVVAQDNGLQAALSRLQQRNKGRATVAVHRPMAPSTSPPFAGAPGVTGPIRDVVQARGPAADMAAAHLSRYWRVDDVDTLLTHASAAMDGGWGLAADDGCVLHPDGTLSAGTARVDDLGAQGLLEDAVKLRADLTAAHAAMQAELTTLRTAADEARRTLQQSERRRDDLRGELKQAEATHRKAEQRWRDYETELQQRDTETARLQEEREAVAGRITGLEAELATAAEALKQANARYAEIREQSAELRDEADGMRSARDQLREKQVEAGAALERARGEVARQQALRDEYERRLDHLEQERVSAGEALEDAGDRLGRLKAELAVMEEEARELHKTLAERRKAYDELQQQRAELDGELSQYSEELSKLADRIHIKELERKDLLHRLDSIRERILESYEIDVLDRRQEELPLAVEEDNPFLEQPLGELREQLRDFGPVNQMALEEFEVVDRRYQTMSEQHADLQQAVALLEDSIREINGIARQRFLETFSRVEGHFVGLFSRLFGGGDAALNLAEGDPLEAGIQILASPKGKKLSSIELMSGGEKALTAIALLFALYLERPSPFCFLDEVDAPLDDVNVIRFNRLLREFTDRTQFLVVTHNKLTMERADRLYGVTMEEEGISTLVAVKIGDADQQGVDA